jgi:hypothetical protein
MKKPIQAGDLYEMHRITTGRHNFYLHAATELAKLKETT